MGLAGTDAEDRMLGLPSTSVLTTFLKERTDFPKETQRCYRIEGPALTLSHPNLFPAPCCLKITRLESE